ncbi:MAG: hypothetical protein ACKO3W_11280 [bacterium]
MRAIAFCAVLFACFPLAKAVELSCVLAIGDPTTVSAGSEGTSVVGRIGEVAAIVASATAGLAGMSAAALVALALATIFLAIRARTPRIGATVTSLALFAAIASHSIELQGAVLALGAGAFGITVSVAVVGATAALAARWIEDVALSVALEKSIDPLAISRELDAEVGDAARLGVSSVDQASFRLAGALGRTVAERGLGASHVEEPGLSGQGSPIPRRMPDDDPLSIRVA